MAAKNWSNEQVAKVEELEEILFRDDVTEVQILGDGEVTVHTDADSFVAEGLSFPDEILRDFVNELLLPYLTETPRAKKVSKSGNPAKRAAENEALGVGREQQMNKVRALTEVHDADLTLPHSSDKEIAPIRVREHSIWPPIVSKAHITLRKWRRVTEGPSLADSNLSVG